MQPQPPPPPPPTGKSIVSECVRRSLGVGNVANASRPPTALQYLAEYKLVDKRPLTERHCEVPDEPRSTFLMVFSPDGTKVASTHGNHNVYVSELSTGKHVKTLSGHPRTPWCIAFHPSHTQLLASGCLGGQVRVWDLSGGSEVWTVTSETVIASIAFHPRDQLLVIATYNELHFWDWSRPTPFISVTTHSPRSKVRFVAFDALGHKLITGISCWNYPTTSSSIVQPVPNPQPLNLSTRIVPGYSSHEQIVSSYHHLVQRYDSLVRNYHNLIAGRSQITTTTDRGTDPMETDWSANTENSPGPSNVTGATIPANNDSVNNVSNNETQTSSNSTQATSSQRINQEQCDNTRTLLGRTNSLHNSLMGESSLNPRPSTSTTQSAFRPVSSPTSTNNSRTSQGVGTSTDAPRTANVQATLSASLNRLRGFMESSIDNTLNMWGSGSDPNRAPPDLRTAFSGIPVRDPPPGNSQSQNSESLNEAQAVDAINNLLHESGNRILNLLAEARNATEEILARDHSEIPSPENIAAAERMLNGGDIRIIVSGNDHRSETNNRGSENTGVPNEANRNSNLPPFRSELLQLLLSYDRSPTNNVTANPAVPTMSNNDSSLSSSSRETDEVINPIPQEPVVDVNAPSTSGYNQGATQNQQTSNSHKSKDAFERVNRGVQAIERHTEALVAMCNGRRSSLRRVRGMWEDLRREIISLQRGPDNAASGCFSLSAIERCRLLSNSLLRRPRSTTSNRDSSGNPFTSRPGNQPSTSGSTHNNIRHRSINCLNTKAEFERWAERLKIKHELYKQHRGLNTNNTNQPPTVIKQPPTVINQPPTVINQPPTVINQPPTVINQPPPCNHLPSTSNAQAAMLTPAVSAAISQATSAIRKHYRQFSSRSRLIRLQEIGHRRNVMNIRRGELDVTRDRIRMRARRVLAIMFSIMMDCLESDELSNRIITMLRLLKKSLSLTCLLLISHLYFDSPTRNETQPENNAQPQEPNTTTQPPAAEPPLSNTQPLTSENIASRIQEHRNIISLRISRRSRALLRLDQPRHRRRTTLQSRVGTNPSSGNTESAPSPSEVVMSNETSIAIPDSSTNPTPQPPTRTRQSPGSRRHPRPSFSRPSCIYRRFLFNHRLMGNMLQVLRDPNSSIPQEASPPNRLRGHGYVAPGYISRLILESMRENEEREPNESGQQNISVPLVQLNDVPINDVTPNPDPPTSANPNRPHTPASRPMDHTHPIFGVHNLIPNEENDNRWSTTIRFTTECPSSSVHRIQVWDFTQGRLPEISNVNKNVVVRKCKIHNDASIDISRDGRLLVALLPAQRMGNVTHLLGIFSLDWGNLGECLYTTLLEQNAVSVSLSPCARHLAVGLGSRRVSLLPYVRNSDMAVIYRLDTVKVKENDTRLGSLLPIRNLEQSSDSGFTSLNCLRWAPQPGQGLVYANNKGQLKILS